MAIESSELTMSAKLARWKTRLSDLPSLVLPTDYPRSTESSKLVEATHSTTLSDRLSLGLARLALYDDSENAPEEAAQGDDSPDISSSSNAPATPFHIVLSAFVVLLHRYTGDTDLLIATSSITSKAGDPLLLRIKVDPNDSFWELVRRIQFLEKEAENDTVPYEELVKTLGREEGTGPLFRVRFFDESDRDRAEKRFMEQTSSTSDMTIFIETSHVQEPSSGGALSSSRSSIVPTLSLRIHYNSLLFSHARISHLSDQLALVLQSVVAKPLSSIGSINLITQAQRKILPDPRADLEWNGFRGAITDIFSANAAKHPERTCIVENIDQNTTRSFHYKQIDEASNVLAHALLDKGIEREDVVTVYSTRNVDLVVAVMGILKAGATFSVIGKYHSVPQYWKIRALTLALLHFRPRLSTCETANLPPRSKASSACHSRSSGFAPSSSPSIRY